MAWAAAAPYVIGAAGSIIGGLMSQQGQNSANSANASLNEENMAWQERMSDTAVMRRKQDMINAGINPILAAGNPASQPSASMIPMQNSAAQSGPLFAQAAQSAAQVANINANTNKTIAETPANVNAPAKTDYQYKLKSEGENTAEQIGVTQQTKDQLKASTANIVALLPQIQAQTQSAQTGAEVAGAMATLQKEALNIQNALAKAKLPEAEAAAKLWGQIGAGGKSLSLIQEGIMLLKSVLGK